MERKQVYELIDGERAYQQSKWSPDFDDSKWSIGDWLVFIERYVQEGKNNLGYEKSKDANRKIAALAVACMEYNDTNPRVV